MKIYLAGPFFNPMQIAKMDRVKEILIDLGIEVLDPREIGPIISAIPKEERTEELYDQIFEGNIRAIHEADALLACIDEKDSGTAFEIGVAYAAFGFTNVFTFSINDGKANLMLARAAKRHLRSFEEIQQWGKEFLAGSVSYSDKSKYSEIDE